MKALIRSTIASAISTLGFLSVSKIDIDGVEPSGAKIRLLLKVDGVWKKWTGSAWENAITQEITVDSVLAEGASMDALRQATGLEWLLGKNVDFVIALESSGSAIPMVRNVKISGKTGQNQTSKIVQSDPVVLSFESGKEVRVLEISEKSLVSGGAGILFEGILQNASGVWGEWQGFEALKQSINSQDSPLRAASIKVRATLTVPEVGTGEAKLTSISIRHRTDSLEAGVKGQGYLITKTVDIGLPATHAHLMVVRQPVRDSMVSAFCCLRAAPTKVEREALGRGTGTAQKTNVAHAQNFAQHTFKLFFNDVRQSSGYSVSANGEVSFIAPKDAKVTCSYEYNWEPERWMEMSRDADYPDEAGMIRSQFTYRAVSPADMRGALGTFKINLVQGSGVEEREYIGKSTNKLQAYFFRHDPQVDTIRLTQKLAGQPETEIPREKWQYRERDRLLYVDVPVGAEIYAAYSWLAPAPNIEALAAVLNR